MLALVILKFCLNLTLKTLKDILDYFLTKLLVLNIVAKDSEQNIFILDIAFSWVFLTFDIDFELF